jgi:4-hydroxybutyrate dehydrogenase
MPIPMLQFPRVHLEFGAVNALAEELATLKIARPLFVTDRGLVACGVFARVQAALPATNAAAIFDDVPENPTVAGVESAIAIYRAQGCDGVVAVGGGSVIDTAKAVAVLALHPSVVTDYMGHPERITASVAPLIAIPTTAGTGSEASRGAGIHPDAHSRGSGLSSHHIVPKVAICDPDLTLTLPPHLTAGTGMDALSHCVEGFLSTAINPPVDAVALDGVRRVCAYIERAVKDGKDREARYQLMMAALEGGMSIAKGLGAGHALANTFGDRGLHHGTLVTLSLPTVLRLLQRHVPEKLGVLAETMGARNAADAIEAMNARVGLPANLRALGYPDADLDELATDAVQSWFNARSPYRPTQPEFKTMIRTILG